GCNQSRLGGESTGLPHDETTLLAQACAAEVFSPVKAGRLGGEVGLRPGVVGFVNVFAIGGGQMFFRNGVFQLQDAGSPLVGIGKSGELQHRRDVRLVLSANLFHVVALRQVVFTIGQLQPALQQVRGVVL